MESFNLSGNALVKKCIVTLFLLIGCGVAAIFAFLSFIFALVFKVFDKIAKIFKYFAKVLFKIVDGIDYFLNKIEDQEI